MGCLEVLVEVRVEHEAELQLEAGPFVVAVLLVVPEEDRAVRAEELREGEHVEVGVVVVGRTSRHPPPPHWTPKWINTTHTEPQLKRILLLLANRPTPQSFPSSDLLSFFFSLSPFRQTFAILFNTLHQQNFFACAIDVKWLPVVANNGLSYRRLPNKWD